VSCENGEAREVQHARQRSEMEAQPEPAADETKRLERCINDLVSVLALPAMWTGGEPDRIISTSLDSLLRMLRLDFIYLGLNDSTRETPIEMLRVASGWEPRRQPHEICEELRRLGDDTRKWAPVVPNPLGNGDISIFSLRLGLQGDIGLLIAGAQRANFPENTERLVLSVAANQTAIGLHDARLLSEHKRLASELDQRVAQRTRELGQSEERYRVVVETASDAVVSIDDKGAIVFANPATARIFGHDPTELTGQPLTLLMPEYMRELHEGGLKRYLATGQRHINWQGTELTALRKNGEEFPIEVSFGEITTDGHRTFTGFIRDISKRKQAEHALRHSEALLTESQRVSLTGSFSWQVATDKITWSEQLYRIYELEIGVPVTLELVRTRVHPEDLTLYEKMVEQVRKGGNDFEWEYRLMMSDHSIKYLHAVVHATRDKDGQLEYIAAIQDITARRRSEEAVDKARSELARVSRLTTMGELAASIAHEVNQPLTAVTNNANACLRLFANRNLDPEVLRRVLGEIVADGTRASAIISRIRAFIKKAPAEKRELEINEVIQEVLALAGDELQKKQVVVECQLTKTRPLVRADRVQLQQVLLNLIMNSIEAMTAVTDRSRLLWMQSQLDKSGDVLVAVRDSGTGLGSDPEGLFTPFFTTKSNGMGMGLAISRSLIESHNGRLWATPNSPHGAVFSFTLPAAGESVS
jgi:PAS domain S-box-containing protein